MHLFLKDIRGKTAGLIPALLPVVVFIIWIEAYYWLLQAGHYKAFIQPKLWPLLILAPMVLLVFVAVFIARFRWTPNNVGQIEAWVRAAILVMPVVFLGAIYGQSLGAHAFSKRAVKIGTVFSLPDSVNVPSPLKDSIANAATLLDLLKNPARFAGKQVVTDGIAFRAADAPADTFMLFRFAIVCCAADALPLSVQVKSSDSTTVEHDSWVRVAGRFKLNMIEGKSTPVIEAAVIQPIVPPPPEKRYLFF